MQLVVTAGADDAEGFCTGLIGFGCQTAFQRGQIGCAADGDDAYFLLVSRLVLDQISGEAAEGNAGQSELLKVNFKFFIMLFPFR